jgi:hypothetical protein
VKATVGVLVMGGAVLPRGARGVELGAAHAHHLAGPATAHELQADHGGDRGGHEPQGGIDQFDRDGGNLLALTHSAAATL